ncbi:glycosyltransferase family 8 protein [Neolentinus lepideus HHB14362 ss-1]|uniref:Glycosyltransferase family 8 protein n=1 Tax=Neolentinus lepideus HHB14362 ss-1 TaxID=1314782 RepID=A0A165MFP6_9AGAM|nr:glycosyltransferase family 8 protein [Neolentinus lepideus HHB14362 ss-1]
MDTTTAHEPDKYEFTASQDWSSYHQDTWATLFPLVKTHAPRILEVGSWEGRSAVFFAERLCKTGGEVVCVDHFDLLHTAAGRERYARMQRNLARCGKQYRIVDDFSAPGLMTLLNESISVDDPGFDWIHIDGSHEGDDTFLDGELAWRLARNGSIIIFDDYRWQREPETSIHHPRRGIDAFLDLHNGQYEKLSDAYQMIIRKTTNLRLGFLAKGYTDEATLVKTLYSDDRAAHPLSYETSRLHTAEQTHAPAEAMSIALTVDAEYAMAAAVALRSLAEHADEPATVYVLDCGLSALDRERIETSLPPASAVTVSFLALPENSLAARLGTSWAKVDLLRVLPVEKVIYLDADVLCRKSLGELWRTDMRGDAIAAVPDIRYPLGHPGVPREAYFNAGVLLLDVAQLRPNLDKLETLALEMKNMRNSDQDALNVFSRPHWTALDLQWNVQGLGASAAQPFVHPTQRAAGALNKLQSPAIVHFTGPVSPSMAQVLDTAHVYTEKPWSYAGAPGHPYREEWWAVLEGTAWKGLRGSPEWEKRCEEELAGAVKVGTQKFREAVAENAAALRN